MYHTVFILLILFSTREFFIGPKKTIEVSIFIILLLFVSLRYGQGSDYFAYIYFFLDGADSFELALKFNDFSYVSREIGFTTISYLWIKVMNLSPESLVILFSAVSFLLVWLFIKKYSQRPVISLFLFYCTFYLIYPFSGIRQSICISIFVFTLTPLLHKKKYVKYYLISILLFTIHYSSVVLFLIPLVNLVKTYKPFQVYLVSILALGVGIALYQVLFSFFSAIDVIASKIEAYNTNGTSLEILSLLLRIIIFIPVMQTYKIYERGSIRDLFLKVYILGFFLYLIFMSSSLISSRINVYMRYYEVIILVDFLVLVFKKYSNRILSFSYIFIIVTVLYVKNINSFIEQGPYYNYINFFNYPYVTILNKKKITEVRYIQPYFQKFVNYD